MKHHCHCGLEKHLERFRLKKFGAVGVVLMILHVLFHIVECLVLPAALVALGGHAVEEDAAAVSESVMTVPAEEIELATDTSSLLVDFHESLQGLRIPLVSELEL